MIEMIPDGGMLSLLFGATVPVKAVLALLAGMSLWSWTIIFTKLMTLGRAKRQVMDGYERFSMADDLASGLHELGDSPSSPLTRVSTKAVREFKKLEQADIDVERKRSLVKDTLRRMLRQGVSVEMKRLTRSLTFLATCSTAAPFIGLFGTVWGIMDAFHDIGLKQSAALTTVAPGISEALVATAIGLAVAIPATLAYNYFRSMLNDVQEEMINFAGVFLNRVEREVAWAKREKGSH